MKIPLLGFIAMAIAQTSFAQWTTSGANIYNSNTGNVGIGTSAPTSMLQVVSSTNSSFAAQIINNGSTNAHGLYINIGASSTGVPLLVAKNATALFQVSNNGNIGIGTTTPVTRLEIDAAGVDNGTSNALLLLNPSNTLGAGAAIVFGGPSNIYASGIIRGSLYNASTGGTGKLILGSNTTGVSNDELTLFGGNVGIGTKTPDQKLSVNGTIHSKEVKVDLTGWADYVFKSTYGLLSLADLKTYIDKNGHLPEMPSEEQVTKNGINLGELVKLQTKKIEELTLYLMEQQKTNQSQQDQINQLKEQVRSISKTLNKN